jgi:protein O-GlcNAc transferase
MREESVVLAPDARGLRRQGNELLRQGQAAEALRVFNEALARYPNDAFTYCDRGNALQDLYQYAAAIGSYDEALRLKVDLVAALVNRSNAWRALQRLDRALQDVESALRLKPEFAEALNSRGNLLRDLGRLDEAVHCFDQALALKPQFWTAHCNRGKALLDLKQARRALADFEAVLTATPDDTESLYGRGSALLELHERLAQAVEDFARAERGGIDRAETLVGRSSALARLDRHAEAVTCLSEVIRLAPDRDYVRGSLLHSQLQCCEWWGLSAQIDLLAVLIERGRRPTHPQSLLSLLDSPALQLRCARAFSADQYAAVVGEGVPRRGAVGRGEGKIRLAYVSADFCEHPVSRLLVGVWEQHDRERFEVIGVALRPWMHTGEFERRVRASFDRFIEIGEDTDRQLAERLRGLGVDIAVDLMGFTQGLRLGVFAQRSAPVQVNYLGYAGTLGAPYMDYIIADEVVIPRGSEGYYSESVVRLPHSYLPYDDRRELSASPTRAQAGLPEEGVVFCAFTNAYKINAPMFAVWMRLLAELPGSVLWLRGVGEQGQESLRREAQRQGVGEQRLIFAPRLASMAEHLARQGLADLYLDTLPYNAHSTTCDALWAGVPVLTCAGKSFASRVAASALQAVGLGQLVTHTLQEYESCALQLGREPQRLRELKAQLRAARAAAPLFDTRRYTRDLEAAFTLMQQRALRLPEYP